MENKVNTSTKEVKKIKKTMLINGGDMDLYLDMSITDKDGNTKQVVNKKGDSVLANFMRILYVMMSRDLRNNVLGGTFYKLGQTLQGSQISSVSSGAGGVFRITLTGTTYISGNSNIITLGGFRGINLDGRYTYNRINNTNIDIIGTTYSAGWTSGTGFMGIYSPITNIGGPSSNAFQNAGIIVGTGDAPVTIDDACLEKQVPSYAASGGLVPGTSTVSQDTNDSESAQITFTRTFTNSGSVDVEIKEIGFLQNCAAGSLLTMRDVLPTGVLVGVGNTLTVNYRIKTVLGTGTDPGGFLASFMRMLYRQVAQTTRAIFDVDNISRTTIAGAGAFTAIRCGGFGVERPDLSEYHPGYRYGIVVGRGNSSVSMGDYYLETPITHGTGENQMLYYGGFAQDFVLGADYAEFSIFKAIENNSGSAIEISEYILTGSGNDAVYGTGDIIHLYTITRNTLTSPVTVNDGEVLKVEYVLRCIIGGASS